MKKKPNYRFWTRTRNTGVKFLYVAITLTGISARAVIYIKERRFIEAKSWLPHGRINKMLSSYFYVSNALHKFPWEHCKALSIMLNNFKALAIIVVLKRGVFICLNTFGHSIYKLNFNHDCHLNSTSGTHFLHTLETLHRSRLLTLYRALFWQRTKCTGTSICLKML